MTLESSKIRLYTYWPAKPKKATPPSFILHPLWQMRHKNKFDFKDKSEFRDMDRFAGLVANWNKHFEYTDDKRNADWAVLPSDWKYYLREDATSLALRFLNEMKVVNKKIMVQYNSDDDSPIPIFSDAGSPWMDSVVVIRTSFNDSRRMPNEYSMPGFVGDPLAVYSNGVPQIRKWSRTPNISFCGGANTTPLTARQLDDFHLSVENAFSGMGLQDKYDRIYSFRGTVLGFLESAGNVSTDIAYKSGYCAGIDRESDARGLARVRKEYYDSIFGSDYVLCVRGKGNYSYRFYEVLASGRIPVFVNTDSPLPLPTEIDWRKHCVWVEHGDVKNIAKIISDFHGGISSNGFKEMQESNRLLWEDMLTPQGYFIKLFRMMEQNVGH